MQKRSIVIQPPVPLWHVFKLMIVFIAASVACCAVLVLRLPIFGHLSMGYLVWNLFLAWIPFGLSVGACLWWQIRASNQWPLILCGLGWLIFFPNAPYIITDIIHLRKTPAEPVWFDLMVTAAFAWTGFLLGFASLYLMQRLVARVINWRAGWIFVLATTGLTALGIYLGRFVRLNSWNVVSAPWEVFVGVGSLVRHPFMHHQSLIFIFVTAVFLFIAYAMIYAITHLDRVSAGTQFWRTFIQRRIFR
jgi:uncharacterized membrane protein